MFQRRICCASESLTKAHKIDSESNFLETKVEGLKCGIAHTAHSLNANGMCNIRWTAPIFYCHFDFNHIRVNLYNSLRTLS
jgi:hypothetical protein